MSSCAPEAEPNFCTAIVSNPDISGRGVRYAIYTQTIISMLVSSYIPYHEKAFRDSSRNAYVVSMSLMIASIIEWKTHTLSLFDALIVTMLTTMMTAFVTANGRFMRILGLSINLSSFLFTTFWCYWGLQVWQDPSNFGIPRGGENCTASAETIFVVFGHSVNVTNTHLRGFALAMFAIGSVTALASLYHSMIWWLKYVVNGSALSKEAAATKYVKELRRKKKG